MNIEKWIEEKGWETKTGYNVILISELRELLKTHAIVPREPSENILEKLLTMNSVKARYKAMIKASEEE